MTGAPHYCRSSAYELFAAQLKTLEETDSLEADLPKPEGAEDDDYVPVKFHSKISELGVFELWCVSTNSDEKWKLEFSVREDAES